MFEASDNGTASLIEAAVDDVVVEVLPNLPGTIEFRLADVAVDEASGTVTLDVVRFNGIQGTVSVDYRTVAGSADANDFVPTSGTVTFAEGETRKTITVGIVDDTATESLESFEVQLSIPVGGALLGSNRTSAVTIADDDSTALDYLPDLTPIGSTLAEALQIDTTEIAGRTLLRFSTEVANAGAGPLEIWGGATSGDSQQVFQRIYQEGGQSRDILAGEFIYHANHGHIHFEGFASYDLVSDNGDVIASGGKTSFCLINIRQPFADVTANADVVHGRGGNNCGQIQGLSAGYSDVYSASLPDQWIDITNVSDGSYWLEVEADPDNRILESDESNNSTRIRIAISNGQVSFIG